MLCTKLDLNNAFPLRWFDLWLPHISYRLPILATLCFLVLLKTQLIELAYFQQFDDASCIILFKNPPGFGKQNSAYVYLMLPWMSKCQSHAFTVFTCTKPNHSSICIHKCGDWTEKLMKQNTTPTHKPAFAVGPFLSPFSSPAMDSESLVAVASGIGITPAILLSRQYSRRAAG